MLKYSFSEKQLSEKLYMDITSVWELKMKAKMTIITLLLCSFFYTSVYARNLDEIKKSGILKAAVDGNTPGFNYYSNGVLTGLEVDLAETIAKRMGLKIEWTVQPFNTLLIALRQDRFDLIAGSHTITPQRSQLVDFIIPHYCNGANIVTKAGGPRTAAELKDKNVSVAVGTVYYDKLTTIPGIKKIMTVPSEIDGFTALLHDRSDAWVTEKPMAISVINASPRKSELIIGDEILYQTNAMAIAKGNTDLQSAINKAMQEIIQDGTYATLMKKYFDENICCK